MSDLDDLMKQIVVFRDARDWKQFHNPKDLAISLSLEAAEFLEHFQWKNGQEVEEYLKKHKEDVEDELADVLYYTLLAAHELNIDILKASISKLEKSAARYPVDKAKGSHKKHVDL